MDDVNYEYRCLDCNHVFASDKQQLTCEKCGSTKLSKHVKMSLNATINISSSISFKGKSNKKLTAKNILSLNLNIKKLKII
jgi:DNA-directed RNA polymerase subunit RPC12/RpoP